MNYQEENLRLLRELHGRRNELCEEMEDTGVSRDGEDCMTKETCFSSKFWSLYAVYLQCVYLSIKNIILKHKE